MEPLSGAAPPVAITVASDLRETRPRYAKGAKWIREATISPSGARAAFSFRGEIVTVPGEKGDPRDLTDSVSAHDRFPRLVARRQIHRLWTGRRRSTGTT